jgi:integrase
LIEFFGKEKILTGITGNHVAKLVAWRRGHKVRNGPFISTFTVNDTTEQLKKIFSRAKAWGVRFDHEPRWKEHLLKEPQERVRELHDDEAERLDRAMREDYGPFFAFVMASGLRKRECLLRWSEVDWTNREIRKHGKGGRMVKTKITPTIHEILWPLRGHHPEFVFTYRAQSTHNGRVRGKHYPITYAGIKTEWESLRNRAGIIDFRFHDLRHDLATKLLRATGNLKLVQKALNHSDIRTTTRYAHVLDDEVGDAMERVAKSRKNSRIEFVKSDKLLRHNNN